MGLFSQGKIIMNFEELCPVLMHTHGIEAQERPYGFVIPFKGVASLLEGLNLVRAVFRPQSETIGHYHLVSEEAYYIESGGARMTLWHFERTSEVYTFDVIPGDYVSVPRKYAHRIVVTSEDDFICLVASAPPFSPSDQYFINPDHGGTETKE